MPCWVRPWCRYPLAAQTRSSSIRNSGVIQQESNTLPSRLEVQRLMATGRSLMSQRMYTSVCWALAFPLAFPLAFGFVVPSWAVHCGQLQEQRHQLARRAMAAEVALVHAERQRVCPQLEALATTDGKTNDSSAESPEQLNYGATIPAASRPRCSSLPPVLCSTGTAPVSPFSQPTAPVWLAKPMR